MKSGNGYLLTMCICIPGILLWGPSASFQVWLLSLPAWSWAGGWSAVAAPWIPAGPCWMPLRPRCSGSGRVCTAPLGSTPPKWSRTLLVWVPCVPSPPSPPASPSPTVGVPVATHTHTHTDVWTYNHGCFTEMRCKTWVLSIESKFPKREQSMEVPQSHVGNT